MEMKNEFVVESKGHCFICLNGIIGTGSSTPKLNNPYSSSSPSTNHCYSLQSFSRLLKMKMSKVFHEQELIPPQLMAKVEKSKLKVELCKECARLNDQFSGLCWKLEKLKLEVAASLDNFHRKLLNSEEAVKTKGFQKLAESMSMDSSSVWIGKLGVLNVLRKEALQKCSRMLNSERPRLHVQNLTMKKVKREKRKLKINSRVKTKIPGVYSTVSDNCLEQQEQNYHYPDNAEDIDVDHGDKDDSPDRKPEVLAVVKLIDPSMAPATEGNDESNHSAALEYDRLGQQKEIKVRPRMEQRPPSPIVVCPQPPQTPSEKLASYTVDPRDGKYKCNVCYTEYQSVCHSAFWNHYNSVHLKIRYKCPACVMEFPRKDACIRHYQCFHMRIRYQCSKCNKTFGQEFRLKYHLRNANCTK